MIMSLKHVVSFTALLLLVNLNFCEGGDLHVIDFGVCDVNKNYKIKMWTEIKTIQNQQFASGNLTLPFPFGGNVRSKCKIEFFRGGKFVTLLTVNENNACLAMNKYLGEFWYSIERKSNAVTPIGSCPIPEGKYHLIDHPMNYNTITLKTFPIGKMRVTENLLDSVTNEELLCIAITLESRP